MDINSNTDITAVNPTDGYSQTQKLKKLKKAAQQFEAVFLSQVLKSMRQTVPEGELLQRGLASEIYESLFDEELSMKMAEGQTRSFADMIFRQLAGKLNNGVPVEDILQGVEELKKEQGTRTPTDLPNTISGMSDQSSRGKEADPSIDAGTNCLKQLLNQFDNDLELAMAAFKTRSGSFRHLNGAQPIIGMQENVRTVMESYAALRASNTANHHSGEGGYDG